MSRLQSELVSLFGREMAQAAKQLPIDAIEHEAEQVAKYASRLNQAAGKPEQQRIIVQGMTKDTAIALCKWLGEPCIFAELLGKQVNK
jgi:hypothetical protein